MFQFRNLRAAAHSTSGSIIIRTAVLVRICRQLPRGRARRTRQRLFNWVGEMYKRYPDVVFEGCSSGGLRMDHKSLSAFSLFSTSNQIYYDRYPCQDGLYVDFPRDKIAVFLEFEL